MPSEASMFTTKELTRKTWPDFEKFFGKPGEWDACWCIYYHRPRPLPKAERSGLSREQRVARNQQDKKDLVDRGCSHGILVYGGKEPIGWCQYGPKEELPRVDAGRKYRKLALDNEAQKLWRITCFCVDRRHRNRGVASAGLKAVLKSIRKKGGGLVEAYPATRKGALAVWSGTVPMFEHEGFAVVAPFGRSNVLMRKTL
jgi:ribosomal protein S18 acetylase RimI-like enzyme